MFYFHRLTSKRVFSFFFSVVGRRGMSGWVKFCKTYNAIKPFCIMKTVKVSHPLEVENITRLDM